MGVVRCTGFTLKTKSSSHNPNFSRSLTNVCSVTLAPVLVLPVNKTEKPGSDQNGTYLKEKPSVFVVIPAKAGIQGLNNIGRQADSGCQLWLA
jgi:hypothetical protein